MRVPLAFSAAACQNPANALIASGSPLKPLDRRVNSVARAITNWSSISHTSASAENTSGLSPPTSLISLSDGAKVNMTSRASSSTRQFALSILTQTAESSLTALTSLIQMTFAAMLFTALSPTLIMAVSSSGFPSATLTNVHVSATSAGMVNVSSADVQAAVSSSRSVKSPETVVVELLTQNSM